MFVGLRSSKSPRSLASSSKIPHCTRIEARAVRESPLVSACTIIRLASIASFSSFLTQWATPLVACCTDRRSLVASLWRRDISSLLIRFSRSAKFILFSSIDATVRVFARLPVDIKRSHHRFFQLIQKRRRSSAFRRLIANYLFFSEREAWDLSDLDMPLFVALSASCFQR